MIPAEVISRAAALMNDTVQSVYTNAAVIPYLNMAMDDLQEIFEQNNIPVTNETSAVISVPAGSTVVAFRKYPGPAVIELPSDLIEIQQLWESPTGENNWVPMVKMDSIPLYLDGVSINQFLVWAWVNQEIRLPAANGDNDLKLEYIKSIFPTITEVNVLTEIPVRNINSYLGYRTASICAMYIGENETRAAALANDAINALDRTLGISIKGSQSINTRRRPFRAGWKSGSYF